MSSTNPPSHTAKLDRILADAQRDREMGYRDKALKMYPHVCGRCAREFAGKRLSELTVHHRNHNHDDNPQDGSNWELLCLYCHDNEHSRYTDQQYFGEGSTSTPPSSRASPLLPLTAFQSMDTDQCGSGLAREGGSASGAALDSDHSPTNPRIIAAFLQGTLPRGQ